MAVALEIARQGQRATTIGAVTASSLGTTVAANASANTKGSYVQLTASSAHDCDALLLWLKTDVTDDYLVDIAVGGSGSEQVIASNLQMSGRNSVSGFAVIPVPVASGTRISMRCQATTGAKNVYAALALVQGGNYPRNLQRVTTYGANTADSGGVSVDPGGTINTKGAYSQITASSTNPIKFLLVCIGNANNSAMGDFAWLMDIAIGAAASEQIIRANIQFWSNSIADFISPPFFMFEVDIPAGTRIAVRAQCSGNDATDRLFDVVMLGVD